MEYIEQDSSGTDTFYDSGSERYQSGPSGIHETAEAPKVDQRLVRQVYLLTYSQADVSAFPTRLSFAEAVIASFCGTPSRIVQWVCFREKHRMVAYIITWLLNLTVVRDGCQLKHS